MTSSLTELRPPPTRPSPPPTRLRSRPSGGWYWVAAILAVLGLTAAFVLGAVGTITALDRVDDFDRVAIPGAMTVFVADPGTKVVYYESPGEARTLRRPHRHRPEHRPVEPGDRYHH